MKRKLLLSIVIPVITIVAVFFSLYFFTPIAPWKYPFRIAKGNEIIGSIESYYRTNHKYPDTLNDLLLEPELKKKYYYHNNGSYYTLDFNVYIGESIIYDSSDKAWR